MSKEVGAFEAKNRLSQLLAEAERGQRIYITRHGKRVAVLLRAGDEDVTESRDADHTLDRIRAFRESAAAGPESLRTLVQEGRHR
jgi:prevent-host-death family protein